MRCGETRPKKWLLGNLQLSLERAESKTSAQHKTGHHNPAGRCGLWGIYSRCEETQSASSRVPKPRKGQQTWKAGLIVHSTPWRTRPGNGHWEHVLQLLSRQQHGCSCKRHSYSYILEEVPHEALAEGKSSLKLILTWAFNISLWVSSFKQDKYSP